VSADAADDAWAVGSSDTGHTLVEHWSGSQWSIGVAAEGAGSTVLSSVAAFSASSVWAAGWLDQSSQQDALSEYWDGARWSIIQMVNPYPAQRMTGVSGASRNDLWAVGWGLSSASSDLTLAEHWDGKSWTKGTTENPNPSGVNEFNAVAAGGARNAWAVGVTGSSVTGAAPLAELWNGHVWTVIPTPDPSNDNRVAEFNGLTEISATDVWAVGSYQSPTTTLTLAEHWDGSVWKVVSTPSPGQFAVLTSVSATSASDVWAAGYWNDGGSGRSRVLVERWDGNRWKVVRGPRNEFDAGINGFNGISAATRTAVWTAGYALHGSRSGALAEEGCHTGQ
jgi:hypothetical protein